MKAQAFKIKSNSKALLTAMWNELLKLGYIDNNCGYNPIDNINRLEYISTNNTVISKDIKKEKFKILYAGNILPSCYDKIFTLPEQWNEAIKFAEEQLNPELWEEEIKMEVGKWYSFDWNYIKSNLNKTVICKVSKVDDTGISISWRKYLYKNEISPIDGYNYKTMSNVKELSIEEVQQYLPDGHKDKIIIPEDGKWYEIVYYNDKNYIVKYNSTRDVWDYISNKYYVLGGGLFRDSYGTFKFIKKFIREVPISEINQYLPEDHVDKIKDFKLPEKWCVKVTDENAAIIGNFYAEHAWSGYSQVIPEGHIGRYYTSHNLASGVSIMSKSCGSNFDLEAPNAEFPEITFEQWEEHVLNCFIPKIELPFGNLIFTLDLKEKTATCKHGVINYDDISLLLNKVKYPGINMLGYSCMVTPSIIKFGCCEGTLEELQHIHKAFDK